VADVDVRALQPHALLDDVGQELARATDERLALHVLVVPRPFTDEDQARARVPDAEHDLRAALAEPAQAAVADRPAQIVESGGASELRRSGRPSGRRRGRR